MKSFILVIALINLSACSFDSNKDNYSLKNSENQMLEIVMILKLEKIFLVL